VSSDQTSPSRHPMRGAFSSGCGSSIFSWSPTSSCPRPQRLPTSCVARTRRLLSVEQSSRRLRRVAARERRGCSRLQGHLVRTDSQRLTACSGRVLTSPIRARRDCSSNDFRHRAAGRGSMPFITTLPPKPLTSTTPCTSPLVVCSRSTSRERKRDRSPSCRHWRPRRSPRSTRQPAARLGLSSGGEIALTTRRGTTQLPGRVTPSIREDTVFVPFHWGGAQSIHRLTNPVLDPISRMPEFKVCAVEAQTVATARPGHDRLPTEEPVRVCDCNGVTRARIVEAVLAGARSLQSVRCHQGRHRLRLVPAGGAGGDRCDVQPAGYDGQPHPSGPSAGSGPEGCGTRSERLGQAIAGRRGQRHGRCGLPGWSRPVAVTWPNLAFR
jgi:hypothetical protein